MARKTVIHKQSALSEKTKVTSLSQDLIRRMKNTSEEVPIEERIAIIDEYSYQLMASGYSHHQTKNIIKDGLVGYESLVKKVEKGEAVLHRSASEGAGPRKRKKLLGKGNWFTIKKRRHTSEKLRQSKLKKPRKREEKEEERNYTTVLFVSQTPNGILAKQLQKVENVISKLTGDRKLWKGEVQVLRKSLSKVIPGLVHCVEETIVCHVCLAVRITRTVFPKVLFMT